MLRLRCVRSPGRRGFTLLEILLALAVLAVGALVCMSIIMTVSKSNESNKETNIGYKAAQDVMEALLTMTWNDMLAQNNVSFTAVQLPPGRNTGTIRVELLSSTLAEITVTINSVVLVTRRAK